MATNNDKIDEKASSHSEHEVSATKEYARHHHDVGSKDGAKLMEVMNAEYALALSTGPQLKATNWRSLQLFAILLVAFMGSLSNGFDGSGVYSLIVMDVNKY
jgi:hypothetical protein